MVEGQDFCTVFFTTLGYGALHSLLASRWAKDQARRLFGPIADKIYRLAFNTIAVITFIPVAFITGWHIGPIIYRWVGGAAFLALAGQLVALFLFTIAFLQSRPFLFLGIRHLGSDPAPSVLLTTGAYRIARHPLYTTGLMFLWFAPVLTTGTLAFNLAVTLYILAGSELEERRLIAEFGEEYRRYQSKVARLIPFIF